MIGHYELIQAIDDGLLPYDAAGKVGFHTRARKSFTSFQRKVVHNQAFVLDKNQSSVVDYMMINVSRWPEDLSKVLESIRNFIKIIDKDSVSWILGHKNMDLRYS